MIKSKIMYETEDGQLFDSHEDALTHDKKLILQKENQTKKYNQMLKEGKQLEQLFNERLTLLKEAIKAVKKYKELNAKYRDKKNEFDDEYGDVGFSNFIVDDFEVRPTESDLWRAIR